MKTVKFIMLVAMAATSYPVFAQQNGRLEAVRLSIDNDFFNFRLSGTDRYFTNGIRLDYYYTPQKKHFTDRLFIKFSEDRNKNSKGFGLAQFMFTPGIITESEVQQGDRPYAGALYGIYSMQTIDESEKLKLTTEIFGGVMGPMSLADKTQVWFHKILNSTTPEGWENQIPNDIILNYNMNIEAVVVQPTQNLSVNAIAETYSGTLYNGAGVGFVLKLGKFQDNFDLMPVREVKNPDKFRLFVYMRPVGRVMLSNSLLQGGLISRVKGNKESYFIEKDDLFRLNVYYDVGAVFGFKHFSFSISQKLRTPEFENQSSQEIGNVMMQVKF